MNLIDTDFVLRCINSLGCEQAELYWERAMTIVAMSEEKLIRINPGIRTGVSLCIKEGGRVRHFLRNDLNFSAALRDAGAKQFDLPTPDIKMQTQWDHLDLFKAQAKDAGELVYEETRRQYGYFSTNGFSGQSSEESARIILDGHRVAGSSIARVWKKLQLPPDPAEPKWPVPGGKFPFLWSPHALGNILLPFLRNFESDRFLKGDSLLTDLSFPQPMRFDLIDRATPAFDHEGTPTKDLCLFSDGKPRGLLCDRATAAELGVNSTGHCRRSAFDRNPTVGFWGPELFGHETFENELSTLHNGLLVQHASCDEDSICVEESRLVHHGEIGEWVEPFSLSLDLVEFLRRLCAFSQKKDPVGFTIKKSGSTFFVDSSLPWALSPDIESPGRSDSVYW